MQQSLSAADQKKLELVAMVGSYTLRKDRAPAPNQRSEGVPFPSTGHAGDQRDGSTDGPEHVVARARGPDLWRLAWKRLLVQE